ncbi:hypothetical protein L1887_34540 [Cichorium endivia]|nr:hypothetical protein L1887_34540 [Cichorium endivia]
MLLSNQHHRLCSTSSSTTTFFKVIVADVISQTSNLFDSAIRAQSPSLNRYIPGFGGFGSKVQGVGIRRHTKVHQDMTAPLSHYFIYTWHNSYLTGNQLSSNCSEVPIIKAPKRGVRGIELDLWPNSSKKSVHRLIVIHAGKPKGGLKDALKVEKDKVRRLSLAEQALEKAVENHRHDVVRFSEKNILRMYPKGTHITSSNYKPLIGWLHGAQMVAFNMQGYGRSLWLMHGMFRANGGCGYVKKQIF